MNYLERVNKRLKPCELFLGGPNCNSSPPPQFIMIIIIGYFIYVNIDESISSLKNATSTSKQE